MNFIDHAVKNMPFLFSLDVKVPMNYVHNKNERNFGFPPIPIMMHHPPNHNRSKTLMRNPSVSSPIQNSGFYY